MAESCTKLLESQERIRSEIYAKGDSITDVYRKTADYIKNYISAANAYAEIQIRSTSTAPLLRWKKTFITSKEAEILPLMEEWNDNVEKLKMCSEATNLPFIDPASPNDPSVLSDDTKTKIEGGNITQNTGLKTVNYQLYGLIFGIVIVIGLFLLLIVKKGKK